MVAQGTRRALLTSDRGLGTPTQPPRILFAVALMVVGAIIAGLRDLRFDAWGYLLVFASNASTALYLSMISRYGKRSSLNSFGAPGPSCVDSTLRRPCVEGRVLAVVDLPAVRISHGLGAAVDVASLRCAAHGHHFAVHLRLQAEILLRSRGHTRPYGCRKACC